MAFERKEFGIVVVHLTTGEDYIANVTEELEGILVLEKPMMPQVAVDDKGAMRIGMMPLRPYIKDEPILMNIGHTVWIAQASEQMADAYRRLTSPIQLAPANALSALPGTGRISL